MRRFFSTLFVLVLLAALGGLAAAWFWLRQPLDLRTPTVDLSIEPGMLPRTVAQAVRDAGFEQAELDPKGFRSGSMNELLPDPDRFR